MGKRKKESAKRIKEARAKKAFAILRNCPTSPRKMRLVADMVRGMEAMRAFQVELRNYYAQPLRTGNRKMKVLLQRIADCSLKR